MKTCNNCYWADKCADAGRRCEYYDPLFGNDNIALREYKKDLKEREDDYRELVNEQQDIYEDEV